MPGLDQSIFHWINGWPDFLGPLFYFLSMATKLWYGIALLVAITAFLLRQPKFRIPVGLAIISVIVGNFICDLFKKGLQWPRPCAVDPTTILRVEKLTSFGTASAHSANMAAVATVMWFVDKRWGAAWTVVAFLVGISRIYNGVHYPSQVLLGWSVGAFTSALLLLATRKLRGAHNQADDPERS